MGESNTPQKTPASRFVFKLLAHSLASALLFCAGYLLPQGGMALIMFCPTPLALLGVSEGKKWMATGLVLASLFLALLDPWLSLYFFLGQGLLCFGLVLPLSKVDKGSEALLLCAVVSVLSKILFMGTTVSLTGQNPFMASPEAMREMLAQMYSSTLLQSGGEAEVLKESMEQMIAFLPYMLPSVIVLFSMLDSFMNYKLCEYLSRKREKTFPPLPSLARWNFPKSLVWAMLLAFLLPFLVEGSTDPLWVMLETNLKFLVSIFFFLQGVSCVWWWMERRKLKFFLKVLLTVLLSLPIFAMWIIALGLGDMSLDLRARLEKRG